MESPNAMIETVEITFGKFGRIAWIFVPGVFLVLVPYIGLPLAWLFGEDLSGLGGKAVVIIGLALLMAFVLLSSIQTAIETLFLVQRATLNGGLDLFSYFGRRQRVAIEEIRSIQGYKVNPLIWFGALRDRERDNFVIETRSGRRFHLSGKASGIDEFVRELRARIAIRS